MIKLNLKRNMMIVCVTIMLFACLGCGKVFAASLLVEKGERYNNHTSNVQETVMVFNNQEMKTKQTMDMDISMNIVDVDKDKNITISYTYDSMKIFIESAGKVVAYDSTQDNSSNPLHGIYSGILGKSFITKLDSKGKVIEVKGLNEIITSVINNAPGTEQQKQGLRDSLKQSFSDDAIKLMMQQNMNNYPPQHSKVGDSWENEMNLNVVFPMVITNKYKLLGEKDDLLQIDMQSAISADTQHHPVDIMGISANVRLQGEINGITNINKKNALLQYGTITQNISGEMELETGKEVPRTIKLPMTITATIISETTKK